MLIMQGDAGVHYLAPTRLVRSYLLIERCYMLEASAGSYSLILRSLSHKTRCSGFSLKSECFLARDILTEVRDNFIQLN